MELAFDPARHPRGRHGHFMQVLSRMHPGDVVRLPDGVRVHRSPGGFHVAAGGQVIERLGASETAQAALDASARSEHPLSVGGETRYASEAAATRGETAAVMERPAGPEAQAQRQYREAIRALARVPDKGSPQAAALRRQIASLYQRLPAEPVGDMGSAIRQMALPALASPAREGLARPPRAPWSVRGRSQRELVQRSVERGLPDRMPAHHRDRVAEGPVGVGGPRRPSMESPPRPGQDPLDWVRGLPPGDGVREPSREQLEWIERLGLRHGSLVVSPPNERGEVRVEANDGGRAGYWLTHDGGLRGAVQSPARPEASPTGLRSRPLEPGDVLALTQRRLWREARIV